jgi:hypothetical protein
MLIYLAKVLKNLIYIDLSAAIELDEFLKFREIMPILVLDYHP